MCALSPNKDAHKVKHMTGNNAIRLILDSSREQSYHNLKAHTPMRSDL